VKTLTLTKRQAEAVKLLGNGHLGVLLHGGTRSGKTLVLTLAILKRALKYPGSRHLMARLYLSHARTSLWLETLLPLLRNVEGAHLNHSEPMVRFPNGSEIWVGGFDDKERIEKLLGHEYASLLFNEVSQISYDAVILGLTRLAQHIEGMRCVAYFDCNPPSPMHWAHKLFIEKVDPKSGKPLETPDLWGALSLNPVDNLANLPPNYMHDILDNLPERDRRRLRDGEWVRPEGMILNHFEDSMIVDEVPTDFEQFTVGLDFGLNMAAVLIGWRGEEVWFLDELAMFHATTSTFGEAMRRKWKAYQYAAYGDPSGGERLQEIGALKANNSVESGLDWLSAKMEKGLFRVHRRCRGWIAEIYDYRKDEVGRIIKENDHLIDSGRYGTFSHASRGIILYTGERDESEKVLSRG